MTRSTDAALDAFRQQGDPAADLVVAKIVNQGDADEVNAMWQHLRHADDRVPADLPPDVANFLAGTSALPPWRDAAVVRLGEEVFARHGPALVTGLLCSSLPHAYSCAKGAEVLLRTGRMTKDLHRRIDETAQMVFDVASPGGLDPDGLAVRTLQKVRLIHATIRHFVSNDPTWDRARLGVPINVEDLAGTMLTFSWSTARAVEQLGGDLTSDEWEAWLHLWRVAGYLLGVPEAILPADRAESDALWSAIKRRQQAPSAAGRELTAALVEHINSYLPGRLWDGTTAELMRTFLGDQVADWLGVPRRNWSRVLLEIERWWYDRADDASDTSPTLARFSGVFNQSLLRVIAYADRGGRGVQFRLPESLREQSRRRWPL